MTSADDVAAALLLRAGTVTTKKLQKLAYYSQAWHLVFTGQPLFSDDIQAWVEGPVVPSLYRQHKRMYQVISHDQMRSFYSRQRTDPDVAVAQAAASAAMEGANLDDDWQSVLREVAAGTRSAAEVIEEEINRARKL